jgi:hypothetical protein
MSRRINWLVVRLYPASQPEGDHDLLNSDNTNQSQWKGPLPADGEYVLRLFIRRGGSVDYRVRLAILSHMAVKSIKTFIAHVKLMC